MSVWLFIGAAIVGFALCLAPWATLIAALGTTIMLCAYFNMTTGPVVQAAERVTRAFLGDKPIGEELQALGRAVYLRRKL